MTLAVAEERTFPDWLSWTALAWLVIWAAIYWHTWGAANFLHLSDIAMILTCLGLWSNSALLISSQAVASLAVDTVWTLDVVWKSLFGRYLMGGTEYLFDTRYPLWVRLITLFHLVMPPLLLWALHRSGYDRRGWILQSAVALPVFIASRYTSPAQNTNFVFADPFFHRAWGPAPVYVAIAFLFMLLVVYFPTHLLLKRLFPPPRGSALSS
jgi:hypothetical protein